MSFTIRAGYYPYDLGIPELSAAAGAIARAQTELAKLSLALEPADADDHGIFYETKVDDELILAAANLLIYEAGADFSVQSETVTSADQIGGYLRDLHEAHPDGWDLDLAPTAAETAEGEARIAAYLESDPGVQDERAQDEAVERARAEGLELRIIERDSDDPFFGWIDLETLRITLDDGTETHGTVECWRPVTPAEFRPAQPKVDLEVTNRFVLTLTRHHPVLKGDDVDEVRAELTRQAQWQIARAAKEMILFDVTVEPA